MNKAISHIKVDKSLESYLIQLEHFYKINEVKINWKRVVKITVHGGGKTLGDYSPKKKKIRMYPRNVARFFKGTGYIKKVMLLVMAHEVAHSQGIDHTKNPRSIMYKNSSFVWDLLNRKSLSSLLLTPYTLS